MYDHLRVATKEDLPSILESLENGSKDVLVRRIDAGEPPFPLLSICTGPFALTDEGLTAVSLQGRSYMLRIADNEVHSVELRPDGGDWYPPELGGVILLVPKRKLNRGRETPEQREMIQQHNENNRSVRNGGPTNATVISGMQRKYRKES